MLPHPITHGLTRWNAPRGSAMGAFMFAVIITAVIATATLAAIQVSRSSSAVEHSGLALLAVGDRVQVALDEVNTTRTGAPQERITTGEVCVENTGVCTQLNDPELTPEGTIEVRVTGVTPDGATAARSAVFAQLPTSGAITGVDSQGRLEFVEDAGSGTDLWKIIAETSS